jgi:hypothetical protein
MILSRSLPSKTSVNISAPYYKREIECPAHYHIPPTVDIYVREQVPELKNISNHVVKTYKIKKERRKKDAYGRPIIDWKKLYQLKRLGIVKQPRISASFAIENVYDPLNPVCIQCNGRCLEGKHGVNTNTIKRLNAGANGKLIFT